MQNNGQTWANMIDSVITNMVGRFDLYRSFNAFPITVQISITLQHNSSFRPYMPHDFLNPYQSYHFIGLLSNQLHHHQHIITFILTWHSLNDFLILPNMNYRLRHRATFDPLSVTHSLKLRAPRLSAPQQWQWTWPLHTSIPSDNDFQLSSIRHVWVSAIRCITVSDDASAIAFVSHNGAVALATSPSISFNTSKSTSPHFSTTISLSVSENVPATVAIWCSNPTSLSFFNLPLPNSSKPLSLLAVGYHSGAIAFFDVTTTQLLAVTRPQQQQPVRRLRYYPAFHLLPTSSPYPSSDSTGGLFAVIGWSGTVARLLAPDLLDLINITTSTPTIDTYGAGWLVWRLSSQQAVFDVSACGSDLSPICELDEPVSSTATLRLVAAGINPPIAAYSVTADQAFSARAVAKRAASSVLSAAKGFLFSRYSSTSEEAVEEERKAINGVVRHAVSWADDPSSMHSVMMLGDVRNSARKSVNAMLQRGRKTLEDDIVAPLNRRGSNGTLERTNGGSSFMSTTSSKDSLSNSFQSSGMALVLHSDESILTRQKSCIGVEAAIETAQLPQNTRIVERIVSAPLPCSLVASCDSLGRIFVQDSRDLCILRILKGYRDAQVAWIVQGGPLMAVYAPRLNVLEVHAPLEQKRRQAFRLQQGSMLATSTLHKVFAISPSGHLHELMQARKGQAENDARMGNTQRPTQSQDHLELLEVTSMTRKKHDDEEMANEEQLEDDQDKTAGPDTELVMQFTSAVKRSQTSVAVELLQEVQNNPRDVAYLMATLLTCTSYIRTEVHIALASKASHIAAQLNNPNLVSRFDAHRRLTEAFSLLAVDGIPVDALDEQEGNRLLEDDLGSGLAEFAVIDLAKDTSMRNGSENSRRQSLDTELVNCERFILTHSLDPALDLTIDRDYELNPRSDLSEEEQIWLAKAYFMKLLESSPIHVPTVGREHPTTADIFSALIHLIGLSEAEITRQFITFFLHAPLLTLLKTNVHLYASPLRCAIARLSTRFDPSVVDPIIIDSCETTTQIAHAVLLLRLCVIHEEVPPDGTAPYAQSLERLDEVLVFRRMIAGSKVPRTVYEKFTGRQCTGVPGDAERHAITCLIEANDFDKAIRLLSGMQVSRAMKNLNSHESVSISQAALSACREKAVEFVTEKTSEIIPKSVVDWILAVKDTDSTSSISLTPEAYLLHLTQLRAVLLSAHQYFPDSSVDAVRCLQLAEAMSALIQELPNPDEQVAPIVSQEISDVEEEEAPRVETIDPEEDCQDDEVLDAPTTNLASSAEHEKST